MAAQVAVPKGSLHHQIAGDDVCGRAKLVLDVMCSIEARDVKETAVYRAKKFRRKKGQGARVFSVASSHAGPA
jgi:hypothetical protein